MTRRCWTVAGAGINHVSAQFLYFPRPVWVHMALTEIAKSDLCSRGPISPKVNPDSYQKVSEAALIPMGWQLWVG